MSSKLQLETCYSCNRKINPSKRGSVKFPCPKCGASIVRCSNCRSMSNRYSCPSCEFNGP